MSIEKGRILIPIARATISRALGREMQVDEDTEWLKEPGACFVTLTQQGELRGCIGSLEAHRPLLQDVKANAYAAAFRDTRFAPLSLAELDYTEVEISLLSPMQPLTFRDEREALAQLRPGIDGVVFECGGRRSTFLPQV
ncbi:MAG: AmmeMemoRadiSam system protein A, partial [Sulfuricella sp.]|nr:AmmeMemoRadiSam system protein A [Sulfuricella sp.]